MFTTLAPCNHGHGKGFIRHRTVRFDGHPELPLAAVEDVALHALGCLAPPSSTAITTSAIRLHGLPLELLRAELRGDRPGPIRRALQELDLRAESIVEVDAQHLFRSNGIEFESHSRPVTPAKPSQNRQQAAPTQGGRREAQPQTGQERTRRPPRRTS